MKSLALVDGIACSGGPRNSSLAIHRCYAIIPAAYTLQRTAKFSSPSEPPDYICQHLIGRFSGVKSMCCTHIAS